MQSDQGRYLTWSVFGRFILGSDYTHTVTSFPKFYKQMGQPPEKPKETPNRPPYPEPRTCTYKTPCICYGMYNENETKLNIAILSLVIATILLICCSVSFFLQILPTAFTMFGFIMTVVLYILAILSFGIYGFTLVTIQKELSCCYIVALSTFYTVMVLLMGFTIIWLCATGDVLVGVSGCQYNKVDGNITTYCMLPQNDAYCAYCTDTDFEPPCFVYEPQEPYYTCHYEYFTVGYFLSFIHAILGGFTLLLLNLLTAGISCNNKEHFEYIQTH